MITAYADYVCRHIGEPERSRGEYAVELLMLGMTWKRHMEVVLRTSRAFLYLMTII